MDLPQRFDTNGHLSCLLVYRILSTDVVHTLRIQKERIGIFRRCYLIK